MESQNIGSTYGVQTTRSTSAFEDNSLLDPDAFLNLMIAQMQNQDFTDPMDDSQMISTMADFSNAQLMQEMASYSKTNYAMSLIGREVTAMASDSEGYVGVITGVVEQMMMVDGEYYLYVNGVRVSMDQVSSIGTIPQAGGVDTEGLMEDITDLVKELIEASKPTEQPDTSTEGTEDSGVVEESGDVSDNTETETGGTAGETESEGATTGETTTETSETTATI